MIEAKKSILVVGFNVRPLAYSLFKAGLEVYAVDFFGDLDLFPFVKDCRIIINELNTDYEDLIDNYKTYLAEFAIDLLKDYPNLDFLLIGSGLDEAFVERKMILEYILKNDFQIISLNNNLEAIKKARDIQSILSYLDSQNYSIPFTIPLSSLKENLHRIKFPVVLKKKSSSGGTNVYKVDNLNDLKQLKQKIKETDILDDWILQEYIDGIPISCTIISNGMDNEIISINRQIIGLKLLNPPKEFMYCGNVVPAYLMEEDVKKIIEISSHLTKRFRLKGINGFDFVLKNHEPYLMEINPRIPGSIRASEESLGINLLNLHINSFSLSNWENVKISLENTEADVFTTKLIAFAPNDVTIGKIKEINNMEYIHDKTPPTNIIHKNHPVCTVLYKDNNFADSFFNALKIADKIYRIIK